MLCTNIANCVVKHRLDDPRVVWAKDTDSPRQREDHVALHGSEGIPCSCAENDKGVYFIIVLKYNKILVFILVFHFSLAYFNFKNQQSEKVAIKNAFFYQDQLFFIIILIASRINSHATLQKSKWFYVS